MDEANLDNIERVDEQGTSHLGEIGPPSLHIIIAIQLSDFPALPTGWRVEDRPISTCSAGQLSDGLETHNRVVTPDTDSCIDTLLNISGLLIATYATAANATAANKMHIMVAICPASSLVCCKSIPNGDS